MIKVSERMGGNLLKLQGNMPDILAYLEKEQERCGKISVSQYLRSKKIDKVKGKEYGMEEIRRGLSSAKRR